MRIQSVTFKAVLRRIYRYRGMAVLVMWQAPSPVHLTRDASSRVHVSFGLAHGVYEDIFTGEGVDCDGNAVPVDRGREAAYRERGGAVEVWPLKEMRASASYGRLTADSADWRGTFGGGMVAYEGSQIGLGAGYGAMAGHGERELDKHSHASLYARLGSVDGWHGRFDSYAPHATLGSTGQTRLGVAYNMGMRGGPGGFAGFALCHFCQMDQTTNTSMFLDLHAPIIRHFDVTGSILFGDGLDYGNWAFGLGGRVNLW